MESVVAGTAALDQIESLQRENLELKAEIAALRDGGSAATPHASAERATPLSVAPLAEEAAEERPAVEKPVPAAASAPAARVVRTHTVAKGDTLYSLAQRYYGSRSRWRDILGANRDQLPNANSALKIGMVLKIP